MNERKGRIKQKTGTSTGKWLKHFRYIGDPDTYADIDSMYLAQSANKKFKKVINITKDFNKKDIK